ncbi:MAG: acyltransferase [Oscillospiraceae bacterium]|nr:acyltransferase [Oscillospiraceae bacterium]
MNSSRKYYLDNMKFLTVFLVVIYHVLMMYSGITGIGLHEEASVHIWDSFEYFVYPWFMMLLFLVSGMTTRISLTRNPDNKSFLKKRTVKFLVPSTLGLFVFQWIQGYFSMKISNSFETIPETTPKLVLYFIMSLSGVGVLWYIQTLWLYSVVLVLIRKITKNAEKLYSKTENFPFFGVLLLSIGAIGFAQILNMPMIECYRFGIYGFAFFSGYYIFAHEEVIDKLSKYSISLLIISILSGIGCTVYFWRQNYASTQIASHPLNTLYGWIMCISLLGTCKKYLNFQNSFMKWCTERSFGLYVFHYLGMSVSAYLLDRYTVLPFGVCMLLSFISSFVIGYGLNEIISRIPVLRWFVLGIRKEKKHVS